MWKIGGNWKERIKKRKREKNGIIQKEFEKTESLECDNNGTHLSSGDEKEEKKGK